MEYSIDKLSKLAGVSKRTLRYYEEIGLLLPKRLNSNNYRVYGTVEIDKLQEILFFRELGVSLEEIKKIMLASDYDSANALENHLLSLQAKQKQIKKLITNVERTLMTLKEEIVMNDKEKFRGFKQNLISENEENYGEEIRSKYGNTAIDKSNARLANMSETEYNEVTTLSKEFNSLLQTACLEGDPTSPDAMKVCALHKKWLCCYWVSYSKEAHLAIAQMYIEDPRFKKYYDNIGKGCAEFLRDALQIYLT